MRGYFEIGIYCPNLECNYGTLMRSAYQLGATSTFVIGRPFKKQSSDTCKSYCHIPTRHYVSFDDFLSHKPIDSIIVAVESPDYGGKYLNKFHHPERAIYLLGNEASGLPKEIVQKCNSVVSIESDRTYSYNVAIAGTLVMYDRYIKRNK